MPTQAALDTALNNLVNTYTGKRVGMTNGSYVGECTSIIERLFRSLGIPVPSMVNNRADGWGVSFPAQLAPYFSHEHFQPGRTYPRGTILMWNSPHIAVVLSHNGSNTVTVFQQNADPDGAPCKTSNRELNNNWHTCTFALIPTIQVAPPPPVIPYRLEPITPKVIQLKTNTYRWNVTIPDLPTILNRPVSSANAGEVIEVNQLCHHHNGLTYYIPADGNLSGYDTNDCEDYVPKIEPPKSSLTDFIPTTSKKVEEYTLVTTLFLYSKYEDAVIDVNAKGTIPLSGANLPKKYIVWEWKGDYVNLTDDNMINRNWWVNTRKNKVEVKPPEPPKPEPQPEPVVEVVVDTPPPVPVDNSWKACYPLFDDDEVTTLTSLNSMPVRIKSLDGKLPEYIMLPPHKQLDIVSWFEKGGVRYYRDTVINDAKRFYSLPAALFPDPYNLPKQDVNGDGDVNISDFIDYGGKMFKSGVAVIAQAYKSPQVQKFVDGIRAGNKKQKDKVR